MKLTPGNGLQRGMNEHYPFSYTHELSGTLQTFILKNRQTVLRVNNVKHAGSEKQALLRMFRYAKERLRLPPIHTVVLVASLG